MNGSRFNSRRNASPVFVCICCGHNTRLASEGGDVCEHCYELGGIDNFFNDNNPPDRDRPGSEAYAYMHEANWRIEQLRANGGDAVAARAKASCEYIWPNG